jgi:hypothetical protein
MPKFFDRAGRLPPPSPSALAIIYVLGFGAVLSTWLNRSGEAPPEAYGIFTRLYFFNDHVESLALLAALLLVQMLPAVQRAVIRLAEWVGAHPRATCGLAFVALAAGGRFVYLAHPQSMDEYVPVMQAGAFARGELTAHYPVPLLDRIVWPPFRGTFVLLDPSTGFAAEGYWPGLALLLTPFFLIHATWALNAALTALALALIGDLAARTTDDPERARDRRGWAMLAALASPAFTVNAMSLYAMPGLLAGNLLFLWLLLRPGHRAAFAAGLVGGFTFGLHNPLPHTLMAVPCLLWMLADRERRRRLPALLAGYLPGLLLLGIGWPMLTASLHFARAIAAKRADAGFVENWVTLIGRIFHLPTADTLEVRSYGTWKIWIWAAPIVALAPFAVRPRDAAMRLLLAAFVLTYLVYFLVQYDQGHGWGYRYIHPAWGALPVAAGVWFARQGGARTLGAIALGAGLLATPVFLWETHETVAGFLAHRIEPPADGRWVVFIDIRGRYNADLVQNVPGRDRVMYLISQGEQEDRMLMTAQFPQAVETLHDERGSAWRLSADAAAMR